MIEAMKTFQMAIKEQEHVLPLISQADLQVAFHCDQQAIQLLIKNSEILIEQAAEEQQTKHQISGNESAMRQLIEGRERLRVLQQRGLLRVSAPLRTQLLLESIFFLTKARDHQQFAKII
ncbi:hypothetical protein [Neobacillus soli]|uniref:hypothetical protein n=1 Tax=Neobacillus soli TaxID=220688 RepID=UPI0008250212|nr:hypothetical protein [Neobacillus soli]